MGKLFKKANFGMLVMMLLIASLFFVPTTIADGPHVWVEQDLMNFGYVQRGNCKGPWELVYHNEGYESATISVSLEVHPDYEDSDYQDLNQFKLNAQRNGRVTLTILPGETRRVYVEYCPRKGIGDSESIVRVKATGNIHKTQYCTLTGQTSSGPEVPFSVSLKALTYYYEDGIPVSLPPNARNFEATIVEGKPTYEVRFSFGDGASSVPLHTSYNKVSEVHYYDRNDVFYTARVTVTDSNDETVYDSEKVHIKYLTDALYPNKWFPSTDDLSYLKGLDPSHPGKYYHPVTSDNYEYPPAFVNSPWFTNFRNSGSWKADLFWNHGVRYKSDPDGKYLVVDEYNFLSPVDAEGYGNFQRVWYPEEFVYNPYTNPHNFKTDTMMCQSFKADCNVIGAFGLLVGRNIHSTTSFKIGLYPEEYVNTGTIKNGKYYWEKRPDVLNPIVEYSFLSSDIQRTNNPYQEDSGYWEGTSWLGLTYQDGRNLKRNPDGLIYFSENFVSSKEGSGPQGISVNPGETYYIGITLDSCPRRDCDYGIYIYGNGGFGAGDFYKKGKSGKLDLFDWDGDIPRARYREEGKDLCFYVWGWNEAPDKPENHVPENGATVQLFEYGSDRPTDSPFTAISNYDGKEGVWLSVDVSDPDIEDRYLEVLFYGTLDPENIYRTPNDLITEENLIGKKGVTKYVRKLYHPDPCTVKIFWPDLDYAGEIPYKWTAVVRDWGMQRTNVGQLGGSGAAQMDAASAVQYFYTSPGGEQPDEEISAEFIKLVKRPFDTEWFKQIGIVADETVTFKLMIINNGQDSLDIEVKDILPEEFEYFGNANIQPDIIGSNNKELTWNFFDINPGSSPIEITFDAKTTIQGEYENWGYCAIESSENANSGTAEYSDSVLVTVFEYPDIDGENFENTEDDRIELEDSDEDKIDDSEDIQNSDEDENDQDGDENNDTIWSRIVNLLSLLFKGQITIFEFIFSIF